MNPCKEMWIMTNWS